MPRLHSKKALRRWTHSSGRLSTSLMQSAADFGGSDRSTQSDLRRQPTSASLITLHDILADFYPNRFDTSGKSSFQLFPSDHFPLPLSLMFRLLGCTCRTPYAYTALPSRALLSLTGQDSAKFLQGLITNDIKRLAASDRSLYAAILKADVGPFRAPSRPILTESRSRL